MARKSSGGGTQLPLIKMTKADYDRAAVKFAKLERQQRDLNEERKAAARKYKTELRDVGLEMSALSDAIEAFEAGRP